ncbi:MAG: DUF4129 domain-containing protein [Anaerolineae bacterium]
MKRRSTVLAGLLLLLGAIWAGLGVALPTPISAQDGSTITVAEFWSRLSATAERLAQGVTSENARSVAQELLPQWTDVKQIADDGTTLDVDLSWLTTPLRVSSRDSLQALSMRIRGLLNYHANGGSTLSALSLSDLAAVLKDPRFQYQDDVEPTLTAPNQPSLSAPNADFLGAALQVLLVAVVVGLILLVGVTLFRSLNTRAIRLPGDEAKSDEPATGAAAVERADQSASIADYRAAIRYLYLAALLKLDEQGSLRYDATLTNREHVDQVRGNPALKERLRQVVGIFDDVWYGNEAVDQAFYEDYRTKVAHLWQPS